MGGAAGAHDAAAKAAAKKPTATEVREEDIRLGLEHPTKNLAEAAYASEGGSETDDHGSEDGIPQEVAAEDDREASREAAHLVMEDIAR